MGPKATSGPFAFRRRRSVSCRARPLEEHMDSSKKAILVTGASSGIGAAIAVRLVEDGHQVVGTHRGAPGKSAGGLELITLDVRSDDSARSCVEAFLQKAGRIDVLVNNAGYLQAGAVEEEAPGPETVAEVFARVVASRRPALRNPVTREAKIFPFLRWLLPAGAFEGGLRSGLNLDKKSTTA